MTPLQAQLYLLVIASYNPMSKFYQSDCELAYVATAKKSDVQCRESIQRINAINSVTEAEIRANCQVNDLFRNFEV